MFVDGGDTTPVPRHCQVCPFFGALLGLDVYVGPSKMMLASLTSPTWAGLVRVNERSINLTEDKVDVFTHLRPVDDDGHVQVGIDVEGYRVGSHERFQ